MILYTNSVLACVALIPHESCLVVWAKPDLVKQTCNIFEDLFVRHSGKIDLTRLEQRLRNLASDKDSPIAENDPALRRLIVPKTHPATLNKRRERESKRAQRTRERAANGNPAAQAWLRSG